jgi:hypothetical protein|tara:strand:- start:8417 stop:8629 length:213 start_codon:yes stop_codon:yes gene_type:complete
MGAAADKLAMVAVKSTCNSTAIIIPNIAIGELRNPPAIEHFGHRQRAIVCHIGQPFLASAVAHPATLIMT